MTSFPEHFVWGAATAAYQIEGAVTADGRGPSIWDTFSHTPGRVLDGDTGDVACDHYHRYRDDVALVAELGLGAYRFSVAWPRVVPGGSGPTNEAGLDFYDRLVDELRSRDIVPMATLYHWDLPQPLEDRGGWTVRDTAERFAEYAVKVYERLGDRVQTWSTLNEPWCSAYLGYGSGIHAPGRRDPAAAFAALHHLLLGHGLAVRALRAAGARSVGLVVNPAVVRPADPASPADADAVRLVDGLHNRVILDPVLGRGYPEDMVAHMSRFGDLDWFDPADEKIIATPIDLLGLNYYAPTYVAARPGASGSPNYPGSEGIEFPAPTGPVTDMGWQIDPTGLAELLRRIGGDQPDLPLWITENGAAFPDRLVDGRVRDTDRIRYLDGHLRAVQAVLAEGVDVRGYLAWSLLDNFEWAEGYRRRFGLVYVDYPTQRRTPKDSAHWYRSVVAAHALPEEPAQPR
ncbi:GH1 family beta-glucosidase [Plantactinospora sp. KBS50]|uniref:GH1 family beta-glucosidase n=1 Tax=Plantactinospora sp. KBS50 TaxID=2024580 RepID=UPI000BAB00A9|nr:GH1 family beta-glucosidase [Plantactinospora sp. KBS50]ASW57164.1 beta-glucosidase [Plantactinospora sp. KBS50]